jgi:hypothetical protein
MQIGGKMKFLILVLSFMSWEIKAEITEAQKSSFAIVQVKEMSIKMEALKAELAELKNLKAEVEELKQRVSTLEGQK